MPQPFDTKWLFDFPKRKKEKSNVRISNYMPIILWIIQKCHANISQICNIHNDVFFKVLLQKVKEGAVLSRVVSFYDVWIFLTWLSTFSHAHPDAIDCFRRNQLACKFSLSKLIFLKHIMISKIYISNFISWPLRKDERIKH